MFAQAMPGSDAGGAALLIVILVLYFVPTLIAWARHVPNLGSVVVIDVFLGWTLIGWVVALAMAVRTVPPTVLPSKIPPRTR